MSCRCFRIGGGKWQRKRVGVVSRSSVGWRGGSRERERERASLWQHGFHSVSPQGLNGSIGNEVAESRDDLFPGCSTTTGLQEGQPEGQSRWSDEDADGLLSRRKEECRSVSEWGNRLIDCGPASLAAHRLFHSLSRVLSPTGPAPRIFSSSTRHDWTLRIEWSIDASIHHIFQGNRRLCLKKNAVHQVGDTYSNACFPMHHIAPDDGSQNVFFFHHLTEILARCLAGNRSWP